ncbi:hypothetical protein LCGC14_2081770 [marine sediment metagenome]|uniref:Uncharacterized protein n=1 Tax=marine sediment metagenome TaxID=412755 RepID=A0A0F9EFC3_9ZZZZ
MKNKLVDLRNHLFATLEGLQDEEKPLDVDRAMAVSDVAQKIINTGKLELHLLDLVGQRARSEFLGLPAPEPPTKRELSLIR